MLYRACCHSCLSMCCMGTIWCAYNGHTFSVRAA